VPIATPAVLFGTVICGGGVQAASAIAALATQRTRLVLEAVEDRSGDVLVVES